MGRKEGDDVYRIASGVLPWVDRHVPKGGTFVCEFRDGTAVGRYLGNGKVEWIPGAEHRHETPAAALEAARDFMRRAPREPVTGELEDVTRRPPRRPRCGGAWETFRRALAEAGARRPRVIETVEDVGTLETYFAETGLTVLVLHYDGGGGFDVFLPASDSVRVAEDVDALRRRIERRREQEAPPTRGPSGRKKKGDPAAR